MKFLISQGQAIRSVFGRSRVTHFMVVLLSSQWSASPAIAAAPTSAGSGTLIRFCSSRASATTPIIAESQPWIVWRPITIAAPAIAPAAAAVAPLTKPCRRGVALEAAKQPTRDDDEQVGGREQATVATTAPTTPATR